MVNSVVMIRGAVCFDVLFGCVVMLVFLDDYVGGCCYLVGVVVLVAALRIFLFGRLVLDWFGGWL